MVRKQAKHCGIKCVVVSIVLLLLATYGVVFFALVLRLPPSGAAQPSSDQDAVSAFRAGNIATHHQSSLHLVTDAPSKPARISHQSDTEIIFDELCQSLDPAAAVSSSSPVSTQFEVRRFDGIFSVEVLVEEMLTPGGQRKRTWQRSQYIPDDVIVLRMRDAEMATLSGERDVVFGHDTAPSVSCTEGAFLFHTVPLRVEFKLVGSIPDPNRPPKDAPRRDHLGHMGREHLFGDGATLTTLHFQEPHDFYGLADRGAKLKLDPDAEIRMKNLDINHYALDDRTSLYGAVPLVYAVHRMTHRTCGFLLLNGSPLRVTARDDFGDYSVKFETSDGGVRYFVFPGPTPADVLRQYYAVTGVPFMPPLFALGFHQSRWSYRDQADILAVSEKFKETKLPCDVLWLDIDHTDDKRYFTWNHRLFPDPSHMQEQLARHGRRLVTITDPHIKVDENYFVYAEAHQRRFFITDSTGAEDFRGHCWPGESSWIDFVNPEARKWYAELFAFDKYKGSTEHLFTWIDMNEPSVFSGPDLTMPMDARHIANIPHLQVHNLYGFYHAMAAAEGHAHRSRGKQRPFVLSRSFFAGSQRYTAVWTGDNQARWDHLKASVTMILMLGLCGIPFSGADVGGFFGDPDPELHVRWFQLGVVYPFFRQHSDDHSRRREPFVLRSPQRAFIEAALRMRYRLLPYIYTTFAQTSRLAEGQQPSGWMRHVMFMFPEDRSAYAVTHTFMAGDYLLVRPVTETTNGLIFRDGRATFQIFVPGRSPQTFSIDRRAQTHKKPLMWYSICTGFSIGRAVDGIATEAGLADAHSGTMETIEEYDCPVPTYQRSGSIIPMRMSVGDSTADSATHPIELRIAIDAGDYAEGVLYIDDGMSMEYTKSKYCTLKFVFLDDLLCAHVVDGCELFSPVDTISSLRVVNDSSLPWTHAEVPRVLPSSSQVVSSEAPRSTQVPLVREPSAAYLSASGFELPIGQGSRQLRSSESWPVGVQWCIRFIVKPHITDAPKFTPPVELHQ